MSRMLFGLSFGFAVMIFATQNAFAGANCAARSVVMTELSSKYRETRHAMGMAAKAAVMEIFASPDTGTWTMTVTTPDGTTCLIASGDHFEVLADLPPPKGDPA